MPLWLASSVFFLKSSLISGFVASNRKVFGLTLKLLNSSSTTLLSFKEDRLETLLEDIDFVIEEPKLVSLMGDSGSGKSLLAYAIMSKESEYKAKKNYQAFCFNGKEIENNYEKDISYIPQEPLSSLNPVINILKHFEIHARGDVSNKDDLRKKVVKLLVEFGFNDIGNLLDSYPHEMSGGQRQRVGIARALALEPEQGRSRQCGDHHRQEKWHDKFLRGVKPPDRHHEAGRGHQKTRQCRRFFFSAHATSDSPVSPDSPPPTTMLAR